MKAPKAMPADERTTLDRLSAKMRDASASPRPRSYSRGVALGIVRDALYGQSPAEIDGLIGIYGSRQYWEDWLSDPISIHDLSRLFASHAAAQIGTLRKGEELADLPLSVDVVVSGLARCRLAHCDRLQKEIACKLKERFLDATHEPDSRKWVKVDPLAAIEFLLRERFIADELARLLPCSTAGAEPQQRKISPEPFPAATEDQIVAELRRQYSGPGIGPNLKQVWELVRDALKSSGYRARKKRVQDLADLPEFKIKRRRPGPRQ